MELFGDLSLADMLQILAEYKRDMTRIPKNSPDRMPFLDYLKNII